MGKTVNIIDEMSRELVEKFDSDVRGNNTDAVIYTQKIIDRYNKEVLGMNYKFESFQTIAQKKRKVVISYHESERDAKNYAEVYEKVAQVTKRDFGISTSITKL